MDDLASYRERLMAVAAAFAEAVRSRPGVAGIALYGSLAHGDLTPFSDVDLFAVYDGDHSDYGVEHRVVDGIKVDLIGCELKALEDLAARPPYHLWEGNPISYYILRSILRTPDDTVLWDPTGRVLAAKRKLREAVSYEEILLPAASEQFHEMVRGTLDEASRRLDEGDFPAARRQAGWAGEGFGYLVRELADTKHPEDAASRLGIPEFHAVACELKAVTGPDAAAMEALWRSVKDLWDRCIEIGYRPILAKLRGAGIEDPEKMELIGDYQLFWGGHRLHELGRVIAEMDLTLRWSRYELDQGDPTEAMGHFWPCGRSGDTVDRWKHIGEALKDLGYDCSAVIDALLDDPEIQRLAPEVDAASERAGQVTSSREQAEAAVALAGRLTSILERAIPWMPLLDVHRYMVLHARTSADLARSLSRLEAASEEAGVVEQFHRFCEGRRRGIEAAPVPADPDSVAAQRDAGRPASPSDGEATDVSALQRWYLRSEPVPDPSGERRILGPDGSWAWTDPQGDAAHSLLTEGGAEITLPASGRPWRDATSLPSLTATISGDFTLETAVTGLGGLFAGDAKRRVWLERPAHLPQEVRFEVTVSGDRPRVDVIGRGRLPGEALQFRLERAGERFSAWCSADGRAWFELGEAALPLSGPLTVGLYAINPYWGGSSTTTRFGPLILWSR